MQCAPSLVVIVRQLAPFARRRRLVSSRLVVVSGGRLARNAGRVVRVRRRRRRQSRTRARCARGRVARRVVVNHRHIPMTVRASTNAPSLVVRCGLSASGARDDDDDGDGPKWHIGRMSHRLTNSTPTAAPRAHTNRIMIFHHPSLGFPT